MQHAAERALAALAINLGLYGFGAPDQKHADAEIVRGLQCAFDFAGGGEVTAHCVNSDLDHKRPTMRFWIFTAWRYAPAILDFGLADVNFRIGIVRLTLP